MNHVMKEAYLRWYYGYKNFGDELLLFWVIEYLFATYKLTKLTIEVGDVKRIHQRIKKNSSFLTNHSSLHFVEIKQHKRRRLTHLMNFVGLGKYKKMFKFFGGGEVLSDERPFPHDGRNIPLLFNWSVKNWEFILLWGIWTPKKFKSRFLYKQILPKVKEIITRDPTSLATAQKFTEHSKCKLHEDFSFSVLRKCNHSKDSSNSNILININSATCTSQNIHKIQLFCQTYPDHKILFFPCDMDDDYYCFDIIKEHIPWIQIYDRTKHPLEETIQLFSNTQAGIGSRLHFLLPLRFFNKPFQSIAKAEKVHKMLANQ